MNQGWVRQAAVAAALLGIAGCADAPNNGDNHPAAERAAGQGDPATTNMGSGASGKVAGHQGAAPGRGLEDREGSSTAGKGPSVGTVGSTKGGTPGGDSHK